MKINRDELNKIFRDHLKEKSPPSRAGCPSFESIVQTVRKGTSKKNRKAIIDHALECFYCNRELELLSKTVRYETDLIKLFSGLARSRRKRARIPRISIKPVWTHIMIAAAAVILILISTTQLFRKNDRMNLRGPSVVHISQILPKKKDLDPSELKFKWEQIKGAQHYIFELFDEELNPIWRIRLEADEYLPDREFLKMLKPGIKYFWMISSCLPNGEKIESRLKEFLIISR